MQVMQHCNLPMTLSTILLLCSFILFNNASTHLSEAIVACHVEIVGFFEKDQQEFIKESTKEQLNT